MTPRDYSPIKSQHQLFSRFSSRDSYRDIRRRSRERSRSRSKYDRADDRKRHKRSNRIRPIDHDATYSTKYRVNRIISEEKNIKSTGPSKKLYLTNLSRNIENEHLSEIFGSFGALISAEVSSYEDFHVSNSFAHLIYKNLDDSKKAMDNMNGGQIDGLTISLEYVPYNRVPIEEKQSDTSASSK